MDLTVRFKREFAFRAGVTEIGTPLARVLAQRAGVCQDFSHLMIAGLRAMGLPARYASGYIRTLPPPGRAARRGADQSHAWVSGWMGPEHGWIDIDPTNGIVIADEHVVLAYGRDFSDISRFPVLSWVAARIACAWGSIWSRPHDRPSHDHTERASFPARKSRSLGGMDMSETAGLLDAYDKGNFFCEMQDSAGGDPRVALILERLGRMPPGELKRRADIAEAELYNLGITFTVYSEKDAIDRICRSI